MTSNRGPLILSIAVFSALALGLSAAVVFLQRGSPSPLSMWTPALAALLTYVLIERKKPWDAAVRARVFGSVRRWPIAWTMIPLLLVSYVIAASLHPGLIATPARMHANLREIPGPLGLQIILLVILNLGIGPLLNGVLVGLGEEIGWRGFLYPRLYELFGVGGLFTGGLIWALWHAPMIALYGLNFPGIPWEWGTLFFALFTIPAGIVLYAVCERTGSVLAAGIAHAAMDAVPVFAAFFMATEKLNPLVFGAGGVSMLVLWVVAFFILRANGTARQPILSRA